jgi:hypothetical protein
MLPSFRPRPRARAGKFHAPLSFSSLSYLHYRRQSILDVWLVSDATHWIGVVLLLLSTPGRVSHGDNVVEPTQSVRSDPGPGLGLSLADRGRGHGIIGMAH